MNRIYRLFTGSTFRFACYFAMVWFVFLTGSCKKDEEKPAPLPETGSVTDIEGNVYPTVKIGDLWWMTENLKVTTYQDGTLIPLATDDQSWTSGLGAYCTYLNLPITPGLLYNWNAVSSSSGLAPAGWRIPTDEDWKNLERAAGMAADIAELSGWRGSNEGEKLKLYGTEGWEPYDNVWSTNETGFSADAGSCRLFDGTFGYPGLRHQGLWWSSTENGPDNAWFRLLEYKEKGVFRYNGLKNYGLSVRCVRDI